MSNLDPGIATAVRNSRPRSTTRTVAPANPAGAIISDPGVALANLQRAQTVEQANAGLNAARSQALIGFGAPDLVKGLGFTVDPNTAAAASANQYSTVANLGHQQNILHRHLLNSLAGRGLLHSGDLGYQTGEQTRNYGQALYGAQSNLLDQLGQYLNTYLGTTTGANNDYNQALLAALARLNPQGALGG